MAAVESVSHAVINMNTTECGVCFLEVGDKDCTALKCCGFNVCTDCLNTYYETEIKSGVMRISCPNCPLVHRRSQIFNGVSVELKETLDKQHEQLRHGTNRNSKEKPCPECLTTYDITGEPSHNSVHEQKVTCKECGTEWCFRCHAPLHSSIPCVDSHQGELLLRRWAESSSGAQKNARKCPKCKVWIERAGGCPSMTCARCKTCFCYSCGQEFNSFKHKYGYSCAGKQKISGICFWGGIILAPVALITGVCILSWRYHSYLYNIPALVLGASFIAVKWWTFEHPAYQFRPQVDNKYLNALFAASLVVAGLREPPCIYYYSSVVHLTSVVAYNTWAFSYIILSLICQSGSHRPDICAVMAASVPVAMTFYQPIFISHTSALLMLCYSLVTFVKPGHRVMSGLCWFAWTFRNALATQLTNVLS